MLWILMIITIISGCLVYGSNIEIIPEEAYRVLEGIVLFSLVTLVTVIIVLLITA